MHPSIRSIFVLLVVGSTKTPPTNPTEAEAGRLKYAPIKNRILPHEGITAEVVLLWNACRAFSPSPRLRLMPAAHLLCTLNPYDPSRLLEYIRSACPVPTSRDEGFLSIGSPCTDE